MRSTFTYMTMDIGMLKKRAARASGFTLIEILLVIVIILLLAGALVVFVMPQQEGAEKNTTKLLLANVSTALDQYRVNMGHYPKEDEGGLDALIVKPNFENERIAERWKGPYVKPGMKLEDAWGHKLRYEVVDRSTTDNKAALPYKLSSIGPDGQPDTDDDIRINTETDASGTGSNAEP